MALARSFFSEEIDLESQRARNLFTQSGWNSIVRAAGQAAGARFLEGYVPLRWNKNYARGVLHYIKGGRNPFYDQGNWVDAAEAGANVQTTATKGDVIVRVRVPSAHPVQPDVAGAFRRIDMREIVFVKREFRNALIKFIDSTPVTKAARLNGRARAQVSKAFTTASRTRARSLIFAAKTQSIRSRLS